jgi:hypothetical protein
VQHPDDLFDSIESAHDYVTLLNDVVMAVKRDLESDLTGGDILQSTRRLDAIRLASYHLDKLQVHMTASARILNDLRSIRRLLFEERHTRSEAETEKGL